MAEFDTSDAIAGSDGGLINANNMQNNTDTGVDMTIPPNPALATPGLNNPAWNRQQAVSVRNAFKSYGSSKNPNHILQNLNMTVPKGSIYGLLGASGCGENHAALLHRWSKKIERRRDLGSRW